MRTEPTREATLGQLLDETVSKFPDTDAIVYPDRDYRLTWSQFSDVIDTVAKGLMAMGVQRGEKVMIWATNVPHWPTLLYATARIGAILLTINTNYKEKELEYVFTQSESENIFLIDGVRDTDYVQVVYNLLPELKTQPRDTFHSERFPHLKRVFFLGPEKHRGMYSMNELMSMACQVSDEEYEARKAEVSCYDVVNMQYTSGTTGFPKGVMLTHHNIGNNGYWIGNYQNFTEKDRICIPVPLFHCFGCVLGMMSSLNTGATLVILEKYDPINTMMAIEKERCTAVYGVPTMFIAMLEHPLFDKFDFSTLRTGIMAGSPCPVKSMYECVEKMNMTQVTSVYGLTEASPGITQTRWDEPSVERKCTTVGKVLPGIEMALINPDTGEFCKLGEHGEVCCRGYNVMKGYYNMPEETAKTIDKNGWLHSGDVGVLDEEGYLSITGRLKDMIIRGGENIYPKEVEDFIHTMDGIQDVQVVGVPSKKYGEQPGAFIILKKNVDMTEQDVLDFCRGKIAWYKTPKYIAFVDTYPMTASGKILKYKLREMSAELWPGA